MGAYDISLNAPQTLLSPLAFLGGMGQARQGAAAQQASLDQNRMNQESAAWSGAIQQGFNALRPLALAPFVPQLSQLAQTNPAAAMMAGNLLGMPALTQYGQMQAGFGFDTQLQAQGIQGRKDIYQDEFNRNYQLAYGQSPQNMPLTGESVYNSLPPSEQAMMLSGTGYNPQTIGSAPPQIRQGIMRSIGEGQAMQRQSMEAAFANQRLQGIQENVAIGQDLMQNGGGYSITDPDWQKEFNNLRQGMAQTANDPNIAGQEPQRRMMGDGIRSMYDFVDRANRAGVIKRNVDPVDQYGTMLGRTAEYARKAGIKSFSIAMPGGQRGTVSLDDTPQRVDHPKGQQPGDYWELTPGSGNYVTRDDKGNVKSLSKTTGGDELDFAEAFKKVANPEIGVDASLEATKKVMGAAQEFQNEERLRARTRATPLGQIIDTLDMQSDQALERMGLPAWRNMKDGEKRGVADYIWNTAQQNGQYTEALKLLQNVIGASKQAVNQQKQQILSKAAANPTMHNPQPGTPIPQGPELQRMAPPPSPKAVEMAIEELGKIKKQYPDPSMMPPAVRAQAKALFKVKNLARNP